MSSSSAPASADQLGHLAAARLHARRFGRPLLSSIVTLAIADRLITHPDGGVLAVTRLGRPWPRVVVTAIAYVGLVVTTSVAAAHGRYATTAASAIALTVVIVIAAPKAVRKLRHTRVHAPHTNSAWLITDTATEPHRGVGDQLMHNVTELADAADARLVLMVRPDNTTALRLYARHGFTTQTGRRGRVLLKRQPFTSPAD